MNWFLILALLGSLASVGCRSFLAHQGMKAYPVKIKPVQGLAAPNHYQKDFLYLKTLAEELVPLEDRYFPPAQRAAMEHEILQKLGRADCQEETFLMNIRCYLAAFNNMHAVVAYAPREFHLTGLYPFRIHQVSNEVYVVDIAREWDRGFIGQKIIAINDRPIAEMVQKLTSFHSAENPWAKRKSLDPFGLSQPEYYRLLGLTTSASNSIKLALSDHPPVWIAPRWNPNFQWHRGREKPHPMTARSTHPYDCRIFPDRNLAYLQFNACFDKTAILDGLTMVKPWVRPLVRTWLALQFQRKKSSGVLQGIYDPDRPVFKEYLAKAIGDVNRRGITNLIIDLRRNGGGERTLVNQLAYHLTRREDLAGAREYQYNLKAFAYYDPKGYREYHGWYLKTFGEEPPSRQLLPMPKDSPFFARITNTASLYYVAPDRPVFSGKIIVLANQNTASAATGLVQLIQDNRLGLIVGTTTGSNPTGPTGMTPLKLPHSRILISLPTEYFERALPANGEILQPDYWVENSVADLLGGRDAAFEKALELISRN